MQRSSRSDGASRTYLGVSRAVIKKTSDDKKMQEVDLDITEGESRTGVERLQNYGFSSVPLPPSSNGEAAEAVTLGMGGSRSHPVVIGTDDRRHRPKNLKSGESIQYDDQKQKVHLARDGIVVDSPKSITLRTGNSSITMNPDGTIVVKGSSIRFVRA